MSNYLYRKTVSATDALVPIPPLTLDSYNPGMNISRYMAPGDVLYYAFQDDMSTLAQNHFGKYLTVAVYIPKEMGVTEDVRGIFLLRTPKARVWDLNNDIISDIKSTGRHGCAYRIDLGLEDIVVGGKVIGQKRRAFRFRNMRSYPFLLRNLTVGFFNTDENSDDDKLWSDTSKNWDGVGLQEPLVFDADFDLFKTRNVTLKEIN